MFEFNYVLGAVVALTVSVNQSGEIVSMKTSGGACFESDGVMVTQGDGAVVPMDQDVMEAYRFERKH